MLAFLWALLGLIVGVFLNLAIYRMPRSERLLAPFDCPKCGERRRVRAWSALVAYLLGSRGRCGKCGTRPEGLSAAVEVVTAVAFGLLSLHFGPGPRLLLASLYVSILIVVFFIDWQHRLILNRITFPGVLLALVLTPTVSPVSPAMALLGLAAGGGLFGLLYGVGYLVYRQEVLGLGDVKLAILLGAMLGFPTIMVALLVGSFVGALAAIAMLVTRRQSSRDFMPYGTAMCLGAFASFFVDTPPWP